MRTAAFIFVGLLLVMVQGVAYRAVAGLSELISAVGDWGLLGQTLGEGLRSVGQRLPGWLNGATPNLVLPLVLYLGIHEHSMARGALLSFTLGWALDVLGGGPPFLFRFTMVAIWWMARIASSRVSAQSPVTRMPLAFVASLVESVIILTLLAIFGSDNKRPLELFQIVLPRAVGTALFAPFLFSLAQRLSVEPWGGNSGTASGQGAG